MLELKTAGAIEGTHAIFSDRDRGQALKPRSGASKTPGLRPAPVRGTITVAVLNLQPASAACADKFSRGNGKKSA